MELIALDRALKIISDNPGNGELRKSAAIQGILSEARAFKVDTEFLKDTISLLDHLSLAKYKIDKASWHDIEIVKITADIIFSAQLYAHEETVPCTEWPTPDEVVEYLLKKITMLLGSNQFGDSF